VRYLGLDIGDRHIGVALSDETATLASGLPTLTSIGPKRDAAAIAALVQEHQAGGVVVGLPLRMDGTIGPQAQKVLDLIERLRHRIPVPIATWDERLTTKAAERALIEADLSREKRKKTVDRVAAVLILQGYLDRLKAETAES
jgi:putative Holliday junction resolvase